MTLYGTFEPRLDLLQSCKCSDFGRGFQFQVGSVTKTRSQSWQASIAYCRRSKESNSGKFCYIYTSYDPPKPPSFQMLIDIYIYMFDILYTYKYVLYILETQVQFIKSFGKYPINRIQLKASSHCFGGQCNKLKNFNYKVCLVSMWHLYESIY